MRTTTMDPLCEKYYSISPYAWCGNNPVNCIDPDGRYTEVLANGDGTYTTKNGTADDDLNIYVVDKEGNRTGEIIGQMFTAYSFTNDYGVFVADATINMNDRTGQEFVDHVTIDYPDPIIYAVGALPNMPNDIKTQGKDAAPYRAMPINLFDGNGTKIATARDVGNFGAGFVAGTTGISWEKTRNMFDRLQGGLIKKEREAPVSQEAQRIGFLLGYERLGKYMVNNKR